MYTIATQYGNKTQITQLIWKREEITIDQLLSFWTILSQQNTFHKQITKREKGIISNLLLLDKNVIEGVLKRVQSLKDEKHNLKRKDRLLFHLVAKSINVTSKTIKEEYNISINCREVNYYGSLGKAVKAYLDDKKPNIYSFGCGCDLVKRNLPRYYDDYEECMVFNLRYDILS